MSYNIETATKHNEFAPFPETAFDIYIYIKMYRRCARRKEASMYIDDDDAVSVRVARVVKERVWISIYIYIYIDIDSES